MKLKTKRIITGVLAGVFALLFTGVMIGGHYAEIYSNIINMYFGLKMHTTVQKGETQGDTEYWKSDFVDEDGNYDEEALWEYDIDVARRIAEEGAVLMWNNGGLPLEEESSVSFFGQGSVNYYYSLEGSAHVDVLDAPTLRTAFEDEGFSVNRTLWSYYTNSGYKGEYFKKINEAPWNAVNTTCSSSYAAYGDYAVMVISRAGQEAYDLYIKGSDGKDGSYLDLSQNEIDAISNIVNLKKRGTFGKVILLFNSDHAVSFKNLEPYMNDIDACLWAGSGGRSAAPAVARIMKGTVSPSGKLVDTWVYDNLSAPSSRNFGDYTYGNSGRYALDTANNEDNYIVYAEGVYVGYRYYETRYEDTVLNRGNASSSAGVKHSSGDWSYDEEVVCSFGYGNSYTTFSYSDFTCNKKAFSGDWEIKVKVTNTGDTYSGKEAVLIYLQKPYTDYDRQNGLEKSAVELLAFTKTDDIAPGKSQTVTLTVSESDFKTYDNQAAGTYILEKGDYYFATGNGAHEAVNNILAAKGYGGGNSALAHKVTVGSDDFVKYSKSGYTDGSIGNLFDNIDVNKYEFRGNNSVTYLSRNDWDGTYPETVSLALNDNMVEDMRQNKTPEEDERYADKEFTYGAENGLSLVMLKDYDYDNEYWDQLLDQMTIEEQALLCIRGSMSTVPITSVNAPATLDCDGPLGLTKFYAPGTIAGGMCYPGEPVMAATFNQELIEEMGKSFGENMLQNGFQVLYAPGVNIHRNAFSGRNGEYYSEDCLLNGKMAAAVIRGARSKGCVMTLKHFALNDQDFNRVNCGVWCNEQAARELYFKAFEIGVTEGKTLAVMSSYNRLGVKWSGASKNLLTDLLRGEWGFTGFVISDAWPNYNAYSYIDGLMAGNDLEFTSGTVGQMSAYFDSPTVRYKLRESAHRILYGVCKTNAMNGLDSNTVIVPLTNWWQHAILAVQIVTGVLCGAAATLFVLTFVIRKNKNTAENAENKGVKNEKII